ncbi:hypothetical protein KQI86_08020 [Clostridium sp. MSJ-11]|uniref:DUF6883 domain-containing protein n=1 Tax=Clostridium mobile TaxID=2841512 RepID=A0ABS6EGW0_9CLOT|nr:DUF6883 domain-containing protein [Clostridium mobile]MBU5484273.1 hypothetical protein [Clostridium mobile]
MSEHANVFVAIFKLPIKRTHEHWNEISKVLYKYSTKSQIEIRIFHGNLLLHRLASPISQINMENKIFQCTYSLNHNLLSLLSWELYDSLCSQYNTFNEEFHPISFANENMYIISMTNLSEQCVKFIDRLLKKLDTYMGIAKCDLGHPLHLQLFIEDLYDNFFIKKNLVYYRNNEGDPEASYPFWVHNTEFATKAIDSWEYNSVAPKIKNEVISERGKSFNSLCKQINGNHSDEIVKKLFEQFFMKKEVNIDFTYNVNKSFSFRNVIIPKSKLVDYSLNKKHPTGRHKAKLFENLLSITADDWKYLSSQILEGLLSGEVRKVRTTEYGVQYHIDIQVSGLNNNIKTVRTAWISRKNSNDSSVSLTSAYIADRKDQLDDQSLEVLYIRNKYINKDIYYKELYELANKKGIEKYNSCIPDPVYIDGIKEPMIEGLCGNAYVVVDGKSGFSRWLKKNKIGFKGYKKGYEIPCSISSMSYDRAIAYAEAFSKVLFQNEINSHIRKELD